MGLLTPKRVKEVVGGLLDSSKAARMKRLNEQGYGADTYYKGMWPYDWTKEAGSYKGPEIEEINRQTPFPTFAKSVEDDVNIAGFLTKDPDVANRFAGSAGGGAVYPLKYRKGRELVIDAEGKKAGDIQFFDSGRPFRDAVRSGKYDTVTIKNTADEGDITVALDPKNIRSEFANFDPAKKESANLLASAAPVATAGLLGTGAMLGSQDADAGVITKAGRKMIEGWHGGPHKFDKFSLDKIGSGEGAQAYGHGGYMADQREIAEGYRRTLAGPARTGQPSEISVGGRVLDPTKEGALHDLAQMKTIYGDEALDDALKYIDNGEAPDEYVEAAKIIRANRDDIKDVSGALYKLHYDADPDSLLDWDKPLGEQPSGKMLSETPTGKRLTQMDTDAREAFGEDLVPDNWLNDMRASHFYKELAKDVGDKEAAQFLNEKGIHGVRYDDGFSRGKEGGTSNYVMFDDDLISIQERGAVSPGMLGLLGGGSTAGLLGATAAAKQMQKSPERPNIGFGDLMTGLATGAGSAMADMQQYTIPGQITGLLEKLGLPSGQGNLSEDILNMGDDYEGKKIMQFLGGLLSPL